MPDFDPDAFLASAPPQEPGDGFDPDAFLHGNNAAAPSGVGDYAADIAKSGGIGLAKGAIGVAGTMGDIGSLYSKGASKIGEMVGASPETVNTVKTGVRNALLANPLTAGPVAAASFAPNSQDIQGAIEKTTGEFYEPKTTTGHYAETVGQFAPALIGGEGAIIPRVAKQVIAPALASEAAGEAAKGNALEPYARVAGALLGHGTAAGVPYAIRPQAAIPTVEDLHEAATQGYNNARGYGVEIRRQPVFRLADDMLSDLGNDGFRERNIPKTWNAIEELKSPAGQHVTVDDLDSVRKALSRAGANPLEGAEREASRRAIAAIDNYLENLDPAHVAVNPHYAGDVAREIGDARGNWAAMRRSQDINERLTNADLQAAATGSGANINNAIRQKIKSILTSPKARRGFDQDELAQMERVVRGTYVGNTARLLGKLAPTGVVSGSLGLEIGSHLIGGPAGLGAVPIAGAIAKRIGDASTARQARILDEMVRSRSPLAGQIPPPAPAAGISALPVGIVGGVATVPQLDKTVGDQRKRGGAVGQPAKLTHQSVGYVAKSRVPNKHCSLCSMFHATHCSLVKDPIDPGGLCRRFDRRK